MVPVGAQVDDSWRCAECQNKVPKGRNPSTPRTVAQLKIELNERDQEALQSDLEIGHLPEEKGESVLHAVTVLAAKLGVTLEARDVVYAERVGVTQGAGAEGEVRRERRVVVRLARRHLRDQLLQAARVRRTLTASDAGCATAAVAGPRIFLNERLTRANRQLFHRVREECRKLQWRFSWTKRGRIYARQADGKQAYPIRSEADLLRVFGSGSV
ncbi:Zinc finger DNA binding protein, partial [Operophtera brumata]